MPKAPQNLAASTRARLQNHARAQGQAFDLVLTRYALERLLYRLSQSPVADRFVLKGAMLVMTWFDAPHRGTRDLDLLGFGDPDPDALIEVFRQVMAAPGTDALVFDVNALRSEPIREDVEYGGVRLRTRATLDGARIAIAIDIGFGDAVEPGVEVIDYPVLLDLPAPRLRAYARETVIAEKFQAMVALGRANSRMKDFYDIWVLSRTHAFDPDRLSRAVAATFERRETEIPTEAPDALTPAFAADAAKQTQWRAFITDLELAPADLALVVSDLAAFIMPHAKAAKTLNQTDSWFRGQHR
ncbi:MAG TPA: nucleotidyl transferase AbiEii/AbiGii toxin family protein [Caulobacteraceae bacterium]|jgi:predicted nucleotidyltransferase component of viral defense system|nr:nucleotidyl transferase AbiEii/AbiGii toxin family protein [Caulobacteraceae bacterium]